MATWRRFVLHSIAARVGPEDAALLRTCLEVLSKETDRRSVARLGSSEGAHRFFSLEALRDAAAASVTGRRRHRPVGDGDNNDDDDDDNQSEDHDDDDCEADDDNDDDGDEYDDGDGEAVAVESFVAAYGALVLARLRTFTSGFEELRLLGPGTKLSADDVVCVSVSAYILRAYAATTHSLRSPLTHLPRWRSSTRPASSSGWGLGAGWAQTPSAA